MEIRISSSRAELQVEALLVASSTPVSIERLEQLLPGIDVSSCLKELSEFWAGRGMLLQVKGDTVSFVPSSDVLRVLEGVQGKKARKLSPAAVETLCYIALHQPVTTADIEKARGLQLHKGVMDSLMDAGFVRAAVRRTDSGRAVTYVTTDAFLEQFGLSSLSDLPTPEELGELFPPVSNG